MECDVMLVFSLNRILHDDGLLHGRGCARFPSQWHATMVVDFQMECHGGKMPPKPTSMDCSLERGDRGDAHFPPTRPFMLLM